VVVVLAWVAAGIVIPNEGFAIVGISRFTDSVSLVQGGVGWLPRLWTERREIGRRTGLTLLEIEAPEAPAQQVSTRLDVTLSVAGSGRLPVAASAVRRLGWEAAWVETLRPFLGPPLADVPANDLAQRDPLWASIFPQGALAPPLDLTAEITPLFADSGLRIQEAGARPHLDPTTLRKLAGERIRAAAEPTARVVLIGLDGADWTFIDPLLQRGAMPNLSRILAAGARGILDAPKPIISPPIWTSIATGRNPEDHGILDFVAWDPTTGGTRPIGSFDRLVPAAWNMLTAVGMPIGVVGWWATWPGDGPAGIRSSHRRFDAHSAEPREAGFASRTLARGRAAACRRRRHRLRHRTPLRERVPR
jgi:hypothetical protein